MGRKKGKPNTECLNCSKRFHLSPYWIKRGRNHCSRECWVKSKNIKNTTCKQCGKLFFRKKSAKNKSGNNYCSQKCYWKTLIGHTGKNKISKNYITPLTRIIKTSIEYKAWREAVLNIFDNKCNVCGSKSNLEIHHIKSFSSIFSDFLKKYSHFSLIDDFETLVRLSVSYESFWDINNGEVLCRKCHMINKHEWNLK